MGRSPRSPTVPDTVPASASAMLNTSHLKMISSCPSTCTHVSLCRDYYPHTHVCTQTDMHTCVQGSALTVAHGPQSCEAWGPILTCPSLSPLHALQLSSTNGSSLKEAMLSFELCGGCRAGVPQRPPCCAADGWSSSLGPCPLPSFTEEAEVPRLRECS